MAYAGTLVTRGRGQAVVVATGMMDRPLLFPGNDRPGIMLSSAARRLIEGVEKIAHKLLHSKDEAKAEQTEHQQHVKAIADPTLDVVALEKAKIAGAIRTDFVLSAEIVVIALGSVATQPFLTRVGAMACMFFTAETVRDWPTASALPARPRP